MPLSSSESKKYKGNGSVPPDTISASPTSSIIPASTILAPPSPLSALSSLSVVSPLEIQQLQRWQTLSDLLTRHYYKPNLSAVRVILSVALAHYWREASAVWLLVVGPPSTGKSEVGINTLRALPNVWLMGSLTPQSLLSGQDKDKHGKHSLLYRMGDHGILAQSDFSQFLGMRPWEQSVLAAQLRDLFDGRLDKSTGMGKLAWEGKVTMIVGATRALERYWGTLRNLGDRFLSVSWPFRGGADESSLVDRIDQRIENQAEISAEIRQAAKQFAYRDCVLPKSVKDQRDRIYWMAKTVCALRRGVNQERGKVTSADDEEGPGRTTKSLLIAAKAHAALFGRDALADEDVAIAMKLALDSIPYQRRDVLQYFSRDPKKSIVKPDIVKKTGMSYTVLGRLMDGLVQMGLVTRWEGAQESFSIRERFADLVEKSGLDLFRT